MKPTVFQHNTTLDNPSKGRVWLEADTGMVVRTEHIVTPDTITATFTTRFRHDNRFGVALPLEMGEKIEGGLLGTGIVEGQARYTNFKRFEVQTEGKVNAP